jgi:hypothetical protein
MVAQVTIYLPDAVARRLRSAARRARKSLSAYVAELIDPPPERGRWPEGFFDLAGSTTIEIDDDPPPRELPPL